MSVSSWSRNKMPIFTDLQKLNLETQHFLSGLVHNGWFDLKDLFPLLDRETRTCGKMIKVLGTSVSLISNQFAKSLQVNRSPCISRPRPLLDSMLNNQLDRLYNRSNWFSLQQQLRNRRCQRLPIIGTVPWLQKEWLSLWVVVPFFHKLMPE